MNRLKNGLMLLILISFLCFVALMPVTCILKTVTGIYCPACGMTRAFLAILDFNFLEACYQNLLCIPLLLFLIISVCMLIKDFAQNSFSYIPQVLNFFNKYSFIILLLLFISFVFNNLKVL